MESPNRYDCIIAPNAWQVAPNIYTCGQVTEADAKWFAQTAGVAAVLNLLPPTQEVSEEDGWWADLAVDYDVIPVIWMQPTIDGVLACVDWLEAHQDQTVLVHCSMNYRVSCLVHLIRRLQGSVKSIEADTWLHQVWEPNAIWMTFIDQLCNPPHKALVESCVRMNTIGF